MQGSDSQSTMSNAGCYLFAVSSAAYNLGKVQPAPGSQLEDCVIDFCVKNGKTYSLDSNKHIVCNAGGVGRGFPLSDHALSYFHINLTELGDKSWPTSDGDYLIYYRYGNDRRHWIYVRVDGGTRYNANPNSDSDKPWEKGYVITDIYSIN